MIPSRLDAKDYAVLKAVEVFGSVRGRKSLHMILYLVNIEIPTFLYRWDRRAPFSDELEYRIFDCLNSRWLDTEEDGSGDGRMYEISLSAEGKKLLDAGHREEIDSALARMRARLSGIELPEMELLASTHYVVSHEPSFAHGFLKGPTPASIFAESSVEQALIFLERIGLIQEMDEGTVQARA